MIEQPKERYVYEVQSRNVVVGVFVPDFAPIERGGVTLWGFLGIREKFDSRFLTTEHGRAMRELGRLEDDRINLWERYPGSMCLYCGEAVSFVSSTPERPGQWTHNQPGFHEPSPVARPNYYPLFNVLEDFEDELTD